VSASCWCNQLPVSSLARHRESANPWSHWGGGGISATRPTTEPQASPERAHPQRLPNDSSPSPDYGTHEQGRLRRDVIRRAQRRRRRARRLAIACSGRGEDVAQRGRARGAHLVHTQDPGRFDSGLRYQGLTPCAARAAPLLESRSWPPCRHPRRRRTERWTAHLAVNQAPLAGRLVRFHEAPPAARQAHPARERCGMGPRRPRQHGHALGPRGAPPRRVQLAAAESGRRSGMRALRRRHAVGLHARSGDAW